MDHSDPNMLTLEAVPPIFTNCISELATNIHRTLAMSLRENSSLSLCRICFQFRNAATFSNHFTVHSSCDIIRSLRNLGCTADLFHPCLQSSAVRIYPVGTGIRTCANDCESIASAIVLPGKVSMLLLN